MKNDHYQISKYTQLPQSMSFNSDTKVNRPMKQETWCRKGGQYV